MGYVLFVIALFFTALLIPFSAAASQGASDGLSLFIGSVFPVLFPFFVCSRFLFAQGFLAKLALKKGAFVILFSFFISLVCGIPSAALIYDELSRSGVLGRKRASVLCAVQTLSCPVFITVSVASWLPRGSRLLPLLAISHYAPALIASVLLCLFGKDHTSRRDIPAPLTNAEAAGAFSKALSEAVSAIFRVGGTIVFFRVIYSVFEAAGLLGAVGSPMGKALIGVFELTNGAQFLAAEPTRLNASLLAGLMSFGGICIFIQTKMFFEHLDTRPYLFAKLVLGAASGMLAYLLCPAFISSAEVFGSFSQELGSSGGLRVDRLAAVILFAVSSAFALIICALGCKWMEKRA